MTNQRVRQKKQGYGKLIGGIIVVIALIALITQPFNNGLDLWLCAGLFIIGVIIIFL